MDLAVAGRYAARAREDAAELNRAGELEKARGTLFATARRIRQYAGRHPQMLQVVDELEQTADRHRVSFAAHELKDERFAAYSRREGKDLMGRRVRV